MKHGTNGTAVNFAVFLPLILALVSAALCFVFPRHILIPIGLSLAAMLVGSILFTRVRHEKKKTHVGILLTGVAVCVIIIVYGCIVYIQAASDYEDGIAYMQQENYCCAYVKFANAGDYKDSNEKMSECQNNVSYRLAKHHIKNGDYKAASDILAGLGDFSDSATLLNECNQKFPANNTPKQ